MSVVVIVVIVVVIAGIVIALLGWDRYRGGARKTVSRDGAFEQTSEVFIDPETGQRMRVWYDQGTGEREYRPE